MLETERLAVIEEKALQLDKRVDLMCGDIRSAGTTNGILFGKLMERMNTLILVMIVMSLTSGMNILQAILKGLGIWK